MLVFRKILRTYLMDDPFLNSERFLRESAFKIYAILCHFASSFTSKKHDGYLRVLILPRN